MRRIFAALSSIVALTVQVAAADVPSIPAVGAHQPFLTIAKNVHPQNLMVVYTKVDAAGHLQADPARPQEPLLDFYWLMDGKSYKPVNPMIKNEIRKRLEVQSSSADKPTHFVIDVNDLKEVNSDIKRPKMDVYVSETSGAPEVEAQMNLGPSDGNMRIRVSSIYTEGRAFPPAVYSVTLKGEEIVNGKPSGKMIARKYGAKDKAD